MALSTLLVWMGFADASAQVVVNEFSCSNYSLGVGGNNEDFVEFFNPTAADVDLGGYFLSDNPGNVDKFEIPNGTVVPAGGHLLVICSGEGEILANMFDGGFLNTNFKINQCQGESLVFADPSETVLESYTFGVDVSTTQADHSWSRSSDGAPDWEVCVEPSPEAANGADPFDMYTGYAPSPTFSVESGYPREHFQWLVSDRWIRHLLHLGWLHSHRGQHFVHRTD